MTHDHTPRPLTDDEFETMMRELHEAGDWMLDQLRRRRLTQESPHAPSESDPCLSDRSHRA